MSANAFPPIETADEHGLLALGGNLQVESLILAYRSGIFLWPFKEDLLAWFSPPMRAIILLDEFHISTRSSRALKKIGFEGKIDQSFEQVIRACRASKNRKGQKGTWITQSMCKAFTELHKAGFAHSFETYKDGKLVGGVYGVSIGKMFAAESMFYSEPEASKFALIKLVEYLKSKDITWLDVQVANPFTTSLGAKEIERSEFLKMLKAAVEQSAIF